MAIITGTAGNDVLDGTPGADEFDLSQGGSDQASGRKGDDVFELGTTFDATDAIAGGAGNDTLILGGLSAHVFFGPTTLRDIETIILTAGDTYGLTLDKRTVGDGQTLTIDGSALGPDDQLFLDVAEVREGHILVYGGAGSDTVFGAAGLDSEITLHGGDGDDSLEGGDGETLLYGERGDDQLVLNGGLGAAYGGNGQDNFILSAGQSAYGGKGLDIFAIASGALVRGMIHGGGGDSDFVELEDTILDVTRFHGGIWGIEGVTVGLSTSGNDSKNRFDFSTFAFVEHYLFLFGRGGNDRLIGTDEGNSLFGNEGNDQLYGGGGGDNVVTGSGRNELYGGDGDDYLGPLLNDGTGTQTLYGGEGRDGMICAAGNKTHAYGGNGDDGIFWQNATIHTGTMDGGAGIDILGLDGGTIIAMSFMDAASMNLQQLRGGEARGNGDDNTLDFASFALYGSVGVTIDGAGGDDTITGTVSPDTLSGGRGNDLLAAEGGKDTLTGDKGADKFSYLSAADSTGTDYDVIADFRAVQGDTIDLWFALNAVDAAVQLGTLSSGTFDADLAAAIGAAQLGPHNAVLFMPDAGSLANLTFLVVDANGVAGYQAGEDLVIDVDGAKFEDLDLTDFS